MSNESIESGMNKVIRDLGFDPTDPSKETKVSLDTTATGIRANFEQTDPATKDKITGSVTLDFQKLSTEGYSLEAGKPSIAAPRDMTQLRRTNSADHAAAKEEETVPTSKVPFLAILSAIMAEIVDTKTENRFLQSKVAIMQYLNTAEFNELSAELIEKTADKEAQSLLVQGITSFANAGASLSNLVGNVMNVSEAAKDPRVDQLKNDKTTQEKKIADLETELVSAGPNPNIAIGQNANDNNANPLNARPKEEIQRDIDKEKGVLAKLESNYQSVYSEKLQSLNAQSRLKAEFLQSTFQGASQLLQANFKNQEGALNAEKQMVQGYQQASQSQYDTSQGVASRETQEIAEVLRTFLDIFEKEFAATKVGRS